ncbi:MAG TPA: NAD-dependent epimerase/dehydratase family protein [Candidatus Nanoarchaeia archaeon]|nr:NAD-dependent epimerase/dehydratase family protein [Candidatus Nanoarchaeia archaeon]
MDKIFLTGGAGFIGYHIVKQLLKRGDSIVIYDAFQNFADPRKSKYAKYLDFRLKDLGNQATIIRGDIRNNGLLVRSLKEHKPNIVVHLAALPIAPVSDKLSEDAMTINLQGTVNVLEAMRESPFVRRFIYASSSMVYGDFQYTPADESHPKAPTGVYGATKKCGELLTRVFSKQLGFDHTIIRPSAVYGPTDANNRVSQLFVDAALEGRPLILHGGGASKLDFSYVEDVAEGFILAMKSEKAANQTFNITAGQGRSIREYAEIVKKHVPEARTEERPADFSSPERGALGISKARSLLGYDPKYSIEIGIKKYIDFIRKIERKEAF